MPKVNAVLHGFNVGENSVAGMARIDQERTRLAAEIQENLFPHTVGKGLVRPGTQYLGNTASNAQVRLIPFVKSINETAVLELSDSKLRVWVNDALVTRASVTSTVTNGDFSSSTGWTLATTGDCTATISGGVLTLGLPNRGGTAYCERSVTTSSSGTEHALRIEVTRGPLLFRCGSGSGLDDYITETTLDTGTHSLAFTPAGTYYVRFTAVRELSVIVDSITVESAGVMVLTAPWVAAELREIRTDQSADIVFMAHTNWQQRKIERRGDSSWSLVKYIVNDGPFVAGGRTSKGVKLRISQTRGAADLIADQGFFTPDHVGALFRLTHRTFNATFGLAGDENYTDVWEVNGVSITGTSADVSDRDFTYSVSGTWVGSLRTYRSSVNATQGFAQFPKDTTTSATAITTNVGATLNLDAATSASINNGVTAWYRIGFESGAYTSGSAAVSIDYDGFGGSGIVRVLAYISPTQVGVEVLSDTKNTVYTDEWEEGEWSDLNGWPSAVALFDGRLWWGREDQFWASESDNYYAFNLTTEGDAGSIQRNIATGGAVNFVNWMLPLQRLVFGTESAEATARASTFDEPLTPTNIGVKDASSQGAAPVSPAKIDGRGVFVQRSLAKVYELSYSLERQDYSSASLTRLNEDIGGDGFIELAVQRQPESYIWCVRADGQCPILIYDPAEQVVGWIRYIAAPSIAGDAVIESVCVLPETAQDAVYLSVKRTINGTTVRFVERLMKHSEAIGASTNKMADAATFTAGPVSSITVAHLASETGLVAWGTTSGVSGPITGLSANSSGVVSLGATYTNVWLGLKYSWRYKTSKLAYGGQVTALMQRKRVTQVGLLAAHIHNNAVTVGPDFTTMRALPRIQLGEAVTATAVEATYDFDSFPFRGSWSTDSRVCLKGDAPYPATLLGLLVGVETNEK